MNYTGWQLQDCHKNFWGVSIPSNYKCITLNTNTNIYIYAHPLDFLTKITHPKKLCGNPDAAIQHDSLLAFLLTKCHQILRLLFQKCSAAGRRLLAIV